MFERLQKCTRPPVQAENLSARRSVCTNVNNMFCLAEHAYALRIYGGFLRVSSRFSELQLGVFQQLHFLRPSLTLIRTKKLQADSVRVAMHDVLIV